LRLHRIAAIVLSAGAAIPSRASIIEETIEVPVQVVDASGTTVERSIHVSVLHDSAAPRPYAVAVLNHGRAGTAAERRALKTAPYAPAARWLAGFGFIVAVPIRIGYGITAGEDVEDSGGCDRKNYPPGFEAAAVETLALVNELRKRPDVAQDRGVIVGQSFGGTTAIAVAAMRPRGIQGTINFAGGGGGGPKSHPQKPCSEPMLQRLFSDYGKSARMPTLWLYSENDQYFGPTFPRAWFEGFRASGGRGEFVMFPPVGDNGHLLFSRRPDLWQPKVLEFLASLGFLPLDHARPRRDPQSHR